MKILFYILGLTSTMMILKLQIGSFDLTLFNLILYIIAMFPLLQILKSKKLIIPRSNMYFYFLLILLGSTLVNALFYKEAVWFRICIKNIFSFILPQILFLLGMRRLPEEHIRQFMAGFRLSVILQLLYGLLQYLFYEFTGRNVNSLLFGYLKESFYTSTNRRGGTIAVSGLGYHPTYFAITMVMGFIIFDNIFIQLLCVFLVILSSSKTGLITLGVAFFAKGIYRVWAEKKENRKLWINKTASRMVMGITVSIILIGSYRNIPILKELFTNTVSLIINYSKDGSGSTHAGYYRNAGHYLEKLGFLKGIFGGGSGTSGYVLKYFGRDTGAAWSIESDILDILFNSGFTGFILYYAWNLMNIWKKRFDKKNFTIWVSLFIAGIFYNFIGSWVTVLLVILQAADLNKDTVNNVTVSAAVKKGWLWKIEYM